MKLFICFHFIMIKFITLLNVALQFIILCNAGANLSMQKINPYKKVFQNLLREPPLMVDTSNVRRHEEVKEKWLKQPLDHFDGKNKETWKMRYFVNDQFYQSGGPIFLFVGGEWEIFPNMLQTGHFYDMAKEHEALMFYTEHRYYGKSWPKKDLSTDNLKFLNVLQSLEDLNYFIDFQKATVRALQDAKVILVGGSYSGSMVAWFMKLYPQSAEAAWSSSAPLIAKMDFYDYMRLTMSSIEQKGGKNCAKNLDQAFRGLLKMLKTSYADKLVKRLQICENFKATNPLDMQAFFNGLGNYFASLVQSYSSLIPQFCLRFLSKDSKPTEALIKYLAEIFAPPDELKQVGDWCLDFSYDGMKSIFTDINDLQTGTRPWFYQTCHEFGWFSTTNSTLNSPISTTFSSPFGGQIPVEYFQQLCQDVFEQNYYYGVDNDDGAGGEDDDDGDVDYNVGHHHNKHQPRLTLQQMHNRALTINQIFGGLSNISQRVIFTHGLLDPWRAVGLQHGQNVLLFQDYSHVEDLGSINLSDSVELNVGKLKVASFINAVLRQDNGAMNKLV